MEDSEVENKARIIWYQV